MKKERITEIIFLIVFFIVSITSFCAYRYYNVIKPNTYDIVFKDIDSIVKGSPVRFMGINVGYVEKLKRKNKYVICKIRVTKKGVTIPDETRAKVAFNGLGGSKSIELLPPLSDDVEIRGIIAEESLRINDFVAVISDLRDVCVIINNFVQSIDPFLITGTIKEVTDPALIDTVNRNIQKIIDKEHEIKKGFTLFSTFEKKLNNTADKINLIFLKINEQK